MPAVPVLGEVLGRGRVADVHAYGAQVLKLYHAGRPKGDAFAEAAILARLEPHGLPVPRVHGVIDHDGRWGVVMDRVQGRPLGEAALASSDPVLLLDELVHLQLRLHATSEPGLRPLKARLAERIARAPLDPALRDRLLVRLAALPDGDRICHGDFHPFNVLGEAGRVTIVDWLDATSGPPEADACRSYLLLRLGAPKGIGEAYLARYVAASGVAVERILAFQSCLAAARLVEGVAEEVPTLLGIAGAE